MPPFLPRIGPLPEVQLPDLLQDVISAIEHFDDLCKTIDARVRALDKKLRKS